MLITENQNKQMWTKMLTEQFNVTDPYTLNWVSEYANVHAIKEAALSGAAVAGAQGYAGATLPAGAADGGPGVSPLYATPLNTVGMGNMAAPGPLSPTSTAPGNFFTQQTGSGDIPVSTLPMALNVALMTIGLELVPTIPTKGPWALLTYMDFPYAGGKMGREGHGGYEIKGLDGVGEGRENKPLYFKVTLPGAAIGAIREEGKVKEGNVLTFTMGDYSVVGIFKCLGRMDGGLISEIVSCKKGDVNVSLAEAFAAAHDNGLTLTSAAVTYDATTGKGTAGAAEAVTVAEEDGKAARVDFAQTMVDFVDGFANFATGKKEAMTRAQNETGTGNVIGLRLFSKWIQVGSYEVTATVTRQQLQDLPLYGVNAVSKVMEACQNEITQSINARIVEHVFQLGVTNALSLRNYQGVDLNLWIGHADEDLANFGVKEYKDIYGVDHAATWGKVKNSEVNTSAENLHTRQRRISSRILAASNLIQVTGRRGAASWVVTNAQVATALQDCSQYVVAPMANTFTQNASNNLYKAGTLAGLQVYVDPYMDWNDTRICVGRKGNGNEPGVIFMPYILADTVSITAEGTMAPKMLVNSRYAIADAGFFPEKMYYTFCVGSEFTLL